VKNLGGYPFPGFFVAPLLRMAVLLILLGTLSSCPSRE
jgi:hypothetical protein